MRLAEFEAYLVCPECRGRLERRAERLHCAAGPHAYETVDGVPILLAPGDRPSLEGDLRAARQMQSDYGASLGIRLVRLGKKVFGSTLHLPYSRAFREAWARHAGELALEVGSGITDGAPRQVNLDVGLFRHVHVVASAARIPFADDTFALARSIAVLEHVRHPEEVVKEIHRVLRPGGYVYAEVPFIQHFHAYPNDFQRYTVEGLKVLFREFDVLETGVCVGPSSALLAAISNWLEFVSFLRPGILANLVRLVPLVLLFPLKYLDYLLLLNPRAHELASGVYVLARRR
jgi:SAM-dependent methyltransferase